ncbi:hypothetical protein OAB01_02215 [Bacteroidia bacterium]|jgi:hypothetical protein|nr:hypothetical protein [Bacteroidia bacterium]
MIFGFVSQLRRKERGFNYKPISYDADLKDFRDKVKERTGNPEKKFDFRTHRKSANQKQFQQQAVRFVIVLSILIFIAYLIFTSTALDSFAKWLTNA